MTGLAEPGQPVWLWRSPARTRKLAWSWELAEIAGPGGHHFVGINAARANAIAAEAIAGGRLAELSGYCALRREVRYGERSRVDFLLEDPARAPCYVEVKNVHMMREPGLAEFPDCVTARGARHLRELAAMARSGARAVMLFVVQRGDAVGFDLARDVDPAYAAAFAEAAGAGVEALCYACRLSTRAIALDEKVTIIDQS
jgi:sugar fermentation stimulation protein A